MPSYILCIETSAKACSVAVFYGSELISTRELFVEQSHASKLATLIDKIFTAEIDLKKISAVAVSSGPGSYTGLRIGVSTAKGLCYALNVPLIAINTLEILTCQMIDKIDSDSLLCPMIDARRMEVYCMIVDQKLKELSPVEARVIDEQSFSELLPSCKIAFFGDGAEKCKSMITHHNAGFFGDVVPLAKFMGALAVQKLQAKDFEDLISFEPFYLKEFVAKKSKSILNYSL